MEIRKLLKKQIFILLLLSVFIFASDDIFTKAFYPTYTEVIYTTTSLIEQNPYCLMGFVHYCNFEEVKIIRHIENFKLFNPFPKEVDFINLNNSRLYSAEDYRIINKISKEELYSSKEMNRIEDIYYKTIEISFRDHINCKESASLFKILYLNSKIKDIKQNYTLLKIYTYDNAYTAHRFNALKNENGYYILDPLSCTAGSFDYCVYSHTRRFYDDPSSILYRGRVYRVEEYI
ncbi:MAG: hypothetical protein WC356_07570 [Candidatus Micrarchaeia archaeon]|jgi:hypothetical protein